MPRDDQALPLMHLKGYNWATSNPLRNLSVVLEGPLLNKGFCQLFAVTGSHHHTLMTGYIHWGAQKNPALGTLDS